jgi:hypothetical protein
MKISQASKLAASFIAANIPVMFHGAPGLGKSDLARELAQGLPLIDFRASLLDPVDLRGVPSVSNGTTVWNPPAFLPMESRDGANGILFMDELTNANLAVQGALLQLVLDRRLGEYVMPDSWRIVAAGNRQTDRASANRLSSAAANRFAHIDIEADSKDWQAWAVKSAIHPVLIAFIGFRPELLHKMENDTRTFPTPRAWANVSKAIATCGSLDSAYEIAAALVGQAAAIEFSGFVQVWRELPRIPDIIAAPASTPIPHDPSAKYALACALARAATVSNMDSVVAYLDRLGLEFSIMGVTQAITRAPELLQTSAHVQWAIRNQHVTL